MNQPIRLIVGLGNPGTEYENTRHNAGFHFVDALAALTGGRFREERKFQGEVCRIALAGREVWLLKPTTFMNLSGHAVSAVASYYKISPAEILVAHDEMDIAPGLLRIKKGGGNAGHNGLKDITAQLGTPDFWRLRLGIGHPKTLGLAQEVFAFVLSAPSAEHDAQIRTCIDAAIKESESFACGDLDGAVRRLAPLSGQKQTARKEGAAPSAEASKSVRAKLVVSRCLLGYPCRYDAERRPSVLAELEAKGWTKNDIVTVCPEMEGGLPVPREPAEIMAQGGDGHAVLAKAGEVVTRSGEDVTPQYLRGARKALKTARSACAPVILLKARSPACSPNGIYDGSHSARLIEGQGVAAALLAKNGFELLSEEEIDRLPTNPNKA